MRQRRQGVPNSDTYTVGKGRPPLSTRWKPGQCGNPKGRPKGVKNMTTYFYEALDKKIEITERGKTRKVTVREGIALRVTTLALKGDSKAISLIFSKEPQIAAAVECANIPRITKDMTPKEAMDAFVRTLRGG